MSKLTEQLEQLISQPLANLSYEVVAIEFVKEGQRFILRISIDKPAGIDINDCVLANGVIDTILEQEDPIPQEFTLEVSSPGIQRPLTKPEHYRRFRGERVAIHLYKNLSGAKKWQGRIDEVSDIALTLLVEQQEALQIPFADIAKAHLDPIIEF